MFFFWHNSPKRAGPPHSRGFCITHNNTPQSVGLLWTRDRPIAETSAWQCVQDSRETGIHIRGRIRTRNSSKRLTADPRLTPPDHWHRLKYRHNPLYFNDFGLDSMNGVSQLCAGFKCNIITAWNDLERNGEVLCTVKKERNIIHTVKRSKANWIGCILCRNCILKHISEGNREGELK